MRLSSRVTTRSKLLLSSMLLLAAIAVPAVTLAAPGDNRPTKAYTSPDMPGFNHVTFNSFTGVPNLGDERDFLRAKIYKSANDLKDPLQGVKAGDEILVRVYVHNGADMKFNTNAGKTGVARNTRVRVVLPANTAASQMAQAFVSADNAKPKVIEDSMTFSGPKQMSMKYVAGSARIKNELQDKAIGDDIVGKGVLVGDDNLSGTMRAGFKYGALVTFRVKVAAPAASQQTPAPTPAPTPIPAPAPAPTPAPAPQPQPIPTPTPSPVTPTAPAPTAPVAAAPTASAAPEDESDTENTVTAAEPVADVSAEDELPNAGVSQLLPLFVVSVIVGTVGYRFFLMRRLNA